MPDYFEPIVVRIENEAGTTTGRAKVGGADVVKFGAIMDIAGEIMGLVKEAVTGILKPVKTTVMVILKLVAQLLRPIADVILIGLQPILYLLKPVVKVFNDIMRPFRQIAMNMVKANPASAGAAQTVILMGLMTGLLNLVGQFIKSSSGMILNFIKLIIFYPLTSLLGFGKETVDKAFLTAEGWITSGIDSILSPINNTMLDAAKAIGRQFGAMVDGIDFATPMRNAQGKMQASVNDFWNNIKIPGRKVTGSTTGVRGVAGDDGKIYAETSDVTARRNSVETAYNIKSYDSAEVALLKAQTKGWSVVK